MSGNKIKWITVIIVNSLYSFTLLAGQHPLAELRILNQSPSPQTIGCGGIAMPVTAGDPFGGFENPAFLTAFSSGQYLAVACSHLSILENYSVKGIRLGYAFNRFKMGAAFYEMAFHQQSSGLYSIENEMTGRITPGEKLGMTVIGLSYKYGLEVSAGMGYRSFKATPLVLYEFMKYDVKGHARDWGLVLRLPVHEWFASDLRPGIPLFSNWSLSLVPVLSYSFGNAGNLRKDHQQFQLSGMNRVAAMLVFGLRCSFQNQSWQPLHLTVALEGFDMQAIKSRSVFEQSYDYVKVFRDLYCQRPVDYAKGVDIEIMEILAFRRGAIQIQNDAEIRTSGWGLQLTGIKKLIAFWLGQSNMQWTGSRVGNRFNVRFQSAKMKSKGKNWLVCLEYQR